MGKPGIPCIQLLALVLVFMAYESTATVIKYLPGFEGPLPFYLETGYIGVGVAEEVQLFYYFVKSESNPEEDPLLLWITGGPGCSALSGLTLENGFSYTRNDSVLQSTDLMQVSQAEEFLRRWLSKHKEFLRNPLYIAGDSYSGITIPAIVQRLSNGNEKGTEPMLNLKGYILGNPTTDYAIHLNAQIPAAHGMALISDELYQELQKSCRGEYAKVDYTNLECKKNLQAFYQVISTHKYSAFL
ncbi:Serine carboxypeptidase-like 6 [Linum perenne]